jgi:hypothetical protein
MGTFSFTAAAGGTVVLSAPEQSPVSYSADAVKFVYVPSQDAPMIVSSPNGGEIVPTGSEYVIRWSAPADAASFNLFYSFDKGTTWQLIAQGVSGNSYVWKVPTVRRNKSGCLVKVIGFDAQNTKIGADISDASFTVEVLKLTSPNGRQTMKTTGLNAPQTNITWDTHATERPVASVKLQYTLNGGRTWKSINEVSGNPGSYSWQLRAVKKIKDKCRVAVILKDADGKTVGVDGSDEYFTMEPES